MTNKRRSKKTPTLSTVCTTPFFTIASPLRIFAPPTKKSGPRTVTETVVPARVVYVAPSTDSGVYAGRQSRMWPRNACASSASGRPGMTVSSGAGDDSVIRGEKGDAGVVVELGDETGAL